MAAGLDDYLGLGLDAAQAQWRRILARRMPGARERQEAFLPVEVLTAFRLFWFVSPRAFGGRNLDRLPPEVLRIGELVRRRPSSLLRKMLNLDGSQPNAGRYEVALYAELVGRPDRADALGRIVREAARRVGIGPDRLPDLWGEEGGASGEPLLGQDELGPAELRQALSEERGLAGRWREAGGLAEAATERMVEQRARLGQHIFARNVLRNFEHRCGFCGLGPPPGGGATLLRASHIKPWRDSTGRERLDVANGIAACPNHDAAFDQGLLTVNGGLRVHTAPVLRTWIEGEAPALAAFGPSHLRAVLALPAGAVRPGATYLEHHRTKIFARRGAP